MRKTKLGHLLTDDKGNEREYLERVPATVPSGKALVHNQIIPAAWNDDDDKLIQPAPGLPGEELGINGFRAFLVPADKNRYKQCDCSWASHLEIHFRP